MLSLLWQIWYIIGLIFIVGTSQILENNLIIWSHWPALIMRTDLAYYAASSSSYVVLWWKLWQLYGLEPKLTTCSYVYDSPVQLVWPEKIRQMSIKIA